MFFKTEKHKYICLDIDNLIIGQEIITLCNALHQHYQDFKKVFKNPLIIKSNTSSLLNIQILTIFKSNGLKRFGLFVLALKLYNNNIL